MASENWPPKLPARMTPRHVMAYGVHVLTALGAALGFMALEAVIHGRLFDAFLWLFAALFVDAIDGPLARRLNVAETASRYDGAMLDLIVDFLTYVFVPAAMLLRPEIMAAPFGLLAGLIIMIGSALYFADTGMKTEDWWFKGFPAVWNIVVFYIVVFAPPTGLSFAIILVLTATMFMPVIFVHPVRVQRWRPLTLGMLGLWSLAAGWALFGYRLAPPPALKAVLLATAVYFTFLGLIRFQPEKTRG